jgi:hypothetical protein
MPTASSIAMLSSIVSAAPSSWEFGWEALVAIGTLALALVTAALAWSTRNLAAKTATEVEHSGRLVEASQRQVAASQEQARIAQEALAASLDQTRISQMTLDAQIKPVLVDVPPRPDIEERIAYPQRTSINGWQGEMVVRARSDEVLISMPFRNAGSGLAMIRGVGLSPRTEIGSPAVVIQPANVAAGERGRISFRAVPGSVAFRPLLDAMDDQAPFAIEVDYTDLAGQQTTISRFDIYYDQKREAPWQVRQVHLQEPAATEPYAGSAPTS